MALNWSCEDVVDGENVCYITTTEDDPNNGTVAGDRIWNPVTMSLVWASLQTGIGRITTKNAAEVYARLRFIETVCGPMLRRGDGAPHEITVEEVQAHIGLSTNATYNDDSRAKFYKRFDWELNSFKQRYERETTKEKVQ